MDWRNKRAADDPAFIVMSGTRIFVPDVGGSGPRVKTRASLECFYFHLTLRRP